MANLDYGQVTAKMKECPQTDTQTVYEHGESVWKYTKQIISGNFEGLKLPDWFTENHAWIVNNMYDVETTKLYNIYHDCGKPFCIEYDEEGKRHFPNHAEVSKQTFLEIDGNEIVADLIGSDMDIHTKTADEIKAMNWSKEKAFTLIVTAFAEIHSNAEMFGGTDSVSFKMKWKKVDKRGKMLYNLHKEPEIHTYSYVIVRRDLKDSYKAVQGTHSAIEYFRTTNTDKHPSVIYVLVKNERKLQSVARKLLDRGINFKMFREPLVNNEMTALFTEPIHEDDPKRDYLKKFMLM